MSLPTPEGKQLEVLDLSLKGHVVVLGTAGSGKTTLALYRAIKLAKCSDGDKVLLLTFNKTLVKYLEEISDGKLENIDVHNYHKFARGYLNSVGAMPTQGGIVPGAKTKLNLIAKALEDVIKTEGTVTTLKRGKYFCFEEISWIQKMGIESLDQYEQVKRIGRVGTKLKREYRKYIYSVFQRYLELRKEQGYLYDWEDIAQEVDRQLLKDNTARKYKHIVIDEGQDLSPVMLRSLVHAIPEDGTLTFFGDVAQQIYGNRISWRNAGLSISEGSIWRFEKNYRNSREIAQFARALAASKYFTQEDDLVDPVLPAASSPKPVIVKVTKGNSDFNWLVSYISATRDDLGNLAILVKSRDQVGILSDLLSQKKLDYQILRGDMTSLDINAHISLGTYHSAKGLEFDTVILPHCCKENFAEDKSIQALGSREDALANDIKLLYVAVTRAKRGLIISYCGEKTELLTSIDDDLYQERTM